MRYLLTIVVVYLLTSAPFAATINIPADQPTIQAGIDAATTGDTVLVADGHYYERISFLGKSITVASEYIIDPDTNHILNTIIDADTSIIGYSDTGSVVVFINGEDSLAQLHGMTLQNGIGINGSQSGTSVYCNFSSATIRNCNLNGSFSSELGMFIRLEQCHIIGTLTSRANLIECKGCTIDSTIYGGSYSFLNCTTSDFELGPGGIIDIDSSTTGNIMAQSGPQLTITNSTIGDAGGYLNEVSFDLCNCNTGTIGVMKEAYIDAVNCNIQAISTGSGVVSINRCDVIDGCSSGSGYLFIHNCTCSGGFNIPSNSHVSIDSSVIWGQLMFRDIEGVESNGYTNITNSTLLENKFSLTDEIHEIFVSNSILSNLSAELFVFEGTSDSLTLNCCTFYKPNSELWYTGVPEYLDTTNVFFINPRFCNPDDSDYTLAANSFCLPENNPCSLLIGAKPAGCDSLSLILHVDTAGSDIPGDGSLINPYATIQYAIEQAIDGDTVLVHEGIYFERISYLGKAITVASEYLIDPDTNHILNTILDGTDVPPIGDTVSLVRFINGEANQLQLVGLALQNSTQGILCSNSSPILSHCVIMQNSTGIQTELASSPIINFCGISENGIGVLSNSEPISIYNSLITENSLAIRIRYTSADIIGCKIIDNGQALSLYNPSTANIETCLIDNNPLYASPSGKDTEKDSKGRLTIANSIIRNSDVGFAYSGLTLNNDSVWNSNITLSFDNSSGVITNSYLYQCDVKAFESNLSISNCFLYGDIGTGSTNAGPVYVNETTLFTDGFGLLHGFMYFYNSILISTTGGPIITGPDTNSTFTGLSLQCTDIYGCTDNEWIALYPSQKIDTSFVYFSDPLFCDTAAGDYTIADISICAAANNECGELIGVYDIGCDVGIPVLASVDDTTITEMMSLEFEVAAICDDGTTPILSTTGLPEDATLIDKEDGTGEFSWQTNNFDAGVYEISLFAHHPDYSTLYDSQSLTITVLDSNLVPIFLALPPDQENDVQEGDTLIYTFSAFDPDSTIPIMQIDSAFVPDSISYLFDFISFTDSGNGNGVLEFYPDYTMAELPPDLPGHFYLRWKVIDAIDTALFVFSNSYEFIVHGTDPHVLDIFVDGQSPAMNVVDHTPLFDWSYVDPLAAKAQTQFEIAVGTDDDWTYAEMWNPAPFASSDTFVVYNGSPLIDGETYYARLRVNNSFAWSDWAELSFRMNTPPSVPVLLAPLDSAVVASTQPYLWLLNSIDAEGDDLFYDFQCFDDCLMYAGANIPQALDSTGWMVEPSLYENGFFLWTARAYDGFEYSEFSPYRLFFTNAIEQPPFPFNITYPPDTGWSQVYEFPTTFTWNRPFDPDPLDSVYFRLLLSLDENFTFIATYDSLFSTSHSIMLDYGTHYWWKVLAIDTKGLTTESNNTADFLTWVLGDANVDNAVNIGDAVYLINYIFKGGPGPNPNKAGDINADCSVNIGDAVYMVNYIFKGGPAPGIGCAE